MSWITLALVAGCVSSPPSPQPAQTPTSPSSAPQTGVVRLTGDAGPDTEGSSEHHRLEIDLALARCAFSEEYDNYTETYSGPCRLVGRDGSWLKVAFDGQIDVYDDGKTSRKPYNKTLEVAVLGDLPADEQATWLEGEDPALSPEADAARRRTCFVADHRLYC